MKQKNYSGKWITHFEKSGMTESPDYKNTLKYFEQFAKDFPSVKIKTIGLTPQGRELKVIVVSKDKAFTPQSAKKTNKPIVLIQNGIHAGEIEGKDACMLLLREIFVTEEKKHLLDKLILLIIPVINADGHERSSEFNRPNQAGPKKMGWRTNSQNLNLNRDYLKADTPEIQAFLKLFNDWLPDFMIDNHTTNGADYQYHVTYGIETHQNIHTKLSELVKTKYLPYLIENVERDGFLTAPYIEFKNGSIESGITNYYAPPRLSHGYCAVQNRICLLVETHSLKPFANRVLSTKSMMCHTFEFIYQNSKDLLHLNRQADKETLKSFSQDKQEFPLILKGTDNSTNFKFKGFRWIDSESEITGGLVRSYTNEPIDIDIPLFNNVAVEKHVDVPYAYIIPQQFSNVIAVLKHHQIIMKRLSSDKQFSVEKYRFKDAQFWPRPYEGRHLLKFTVEPFFESANLIKGDFLIPTNQRSLRVILNLLEPEAPDSFVNWGFFNAFFERKEYAESYKMEPYAKTMLENDSELREEFLNLLNTNESFRNSPMERLDFFYKKSPFYDKGENIYPIFRLNKKEDLG